MKAPARSPPRSVPILGGGLVRLDVSGPSPSPERLTSAELKRRGTGSSGTDGHGSAGTSREDRWRRGQMRGELGVWVGATSAVPANPQGRAGLPDSFRSVRDRTLVLGRYSCKSQRHLRTPGPKNHEGQRRGSCVTAATPMGNAPA